MPEIEIICLAISRKMQGKCVAGLRTDGQGWVRPVAPGADGTLYPLHYTLPDGNMPRMMDVIRVGCTGPQPEPHQPENWLLDQTRWKLIARPLPDTLRPLLSAALVTGPDLFGDSSNSRNYNDLLETPVPASLALVVPQNLQWNITQNYSGKRQTKARFSLRGNPYELSVTDAVWEHRLAHLPYGLYDAHAVTGADRIVFTVSLGEPFSQNNHCYKLIAAVQVIPQAPAPTI